MNAITHKQFSQLRNCKTSFNDIYWGFLNTNIAPQRWSDIVSRYNNHKTIHIFHIVTYLYKIYIKSSFNKSTIKPVVLLTKPLLTKPVIESKPLIGVTKPLVTKPVIVSKPVVVVTKQVIESKPLVTKPVVIVSKPVVVVTKPVIESKPLLTKPVIVSKPGGVVVEVIKEKFTGTYRHTAVSNYKEWAKSQRSFTAQYKIKTDELKAWKLEDNFDPKNYNHTHPWFHYIDNHMI